MPKKLKFRSNTALDSILNAIFKPYQERVPNVSKITQAMIKEGIIASESEIENDHIAFRTLGVPNLGIKSFEKIFLYYGYQKMEAFYFKKKKIDAFWYAPPKDIYPRIFISELRINDLSSTAQKIIRSFTESITSDPVDDLNLDNVEEVGAFFSRPLWLLPSVDQYKKLMLESEYAAWVIYNGYYLNHYTISVHELKNGLNTLEDFNIFLESIGVILNTAGGKIKISADGLLKQSSTVAELVEAIFEDNHKMNIAGSYVEFAERLPFPEYKDLPIERIKRHHRRDGFESANADKIFESTYSEQTKS